MEKMKIKVSILPNQFLKENGTFNKKEAIKLSGKIAGVCYDKEGFSHLENEPEEKTMRRVNRTLNSGHHSVYDHILIILICKIFQKFWPWCLIMKNNIQQVRNQQDIHLL